MALTKTEKIKVIKNFAKSDNDTGSPSVQIALLSNRINSLSLHLKTHKKDFSSRKGLLKLVGQRRRLLNYLQKTDEKEYKKVKKALEL